MDSLFVIDIGNTCTDIGICCGDAIQKISYPSSQESMDAVCRFVKDQPGKPGVIIASVVPVLGDLLSSLLENKCNIKSFLAENIKTKLLPLQVDNPGSVGIDRAVNCYAAIRLYGCPAIVVSLGTATTFEAVSAGGEYLGGAIAPGVMISLEALSQKTALLPAVHLNKPKKIIAANTIEHIESGIFYGTISLVEGMVKRMKSVLGESTHVIGTGGISNVFAEEGIFDYHEPDLTLKGLQQVYRNYAL